MKAFVIMTLLGFCLITVTNAKEAGVKYKSGKKLDFEALLIEGENKKAEISVVTGNMGGDDLGLLKLREDFKDLNTHDSGEVIE
jgi:hypothetical protein